MNELLLSIFATICTIAFFLTSLSTMRKFRQQGSVGSASVVPFIAMFVNCTLWTKYGVLLGDTTVTSVNVVGLILSVYYTYTYYMYSDQQASHVERLVVYAALVVYPVLIYVRMTSLQHAIDFLGPMACVCTVIMFGSPLVSLSRVIQTKNTSSMSFPLSLASFIVSTIWFLYGKVANNSNITIPNGLGAVLAVVQVGVLLYYNNKYPQLQQSYGRVEDSQHHA
ncbi:hypothetical protein RI367_001767 [Sorochytrium milnesiophthora]